MKRIESLIVSKTGKQQTCEDGIVFTKNFVAVIDGCTSKSDFTYKKAPGIIAMEIIKETIENFPKEIKADEALSLLSSKIESWYKDENIYEEVKTHPSFRVSACLVVYSSHYNQLWFLGDCKAIVDNKYYCFETKIEEYTSSLRSFLIYAELQKGKTEEELLLNDTAREKLLPILAEQAYVQNELGAGPFSYSVCNGFPINKRDLMIIDLDENIKEIILSSDGYPYLKQTLKESEEELKNLLEMDPLLYRDFKATKGLQKNNVSFDDRSYVRFTV